VGARGFRWGALPHLFVDPEQAERLQLGDELQISGLHADPSDDCFRVYNVTRDEEFDLLSDLKPREHEIVQAGGIIYAMRARAKDAQSLARCRRLG